MQAWSPSPICVQRAHRYCNSLPLIYFKVILFANIPRINRAARLHQVMNKVVVPARTGTRHADRKKDHDYSKEGFSDSMTNGIMPVRMPKLIQILGVANESCVAL